MGVDECDLWPGPFDDHGYGVKRMYLKNGKYGTQKAHRWVWEQANGPIPDGLHVLHHCDNPPCVLLSHLHLGTHQDNMRESAERGRHARGLDNARAKLSDVEVAEIRFHYAMGSFTQAALARRYGVSAPHISRLVNDHRRTQNPDQAHSEGWSKHSWE